MIRTACHVEDPPRIDAHLPPYASAVLRLVAARVRRDEEYADPSSRVVNRALADLLVGWAAAGVRDAAAELVTRNYRGRGKA